MRRLAPLCLALFGAALTPPPGAWAGGPGGCPTCGAQSAPDRSRDGSVHMTEYPAPVAAPATGDPAAVYHAPKYDHGPTCMCPDCQVKRAIEEAEGAPVVIHGPGPVTTPGDGTVIGPAVPCAACQEGAGQAIPMGPAEAPGYASLGGPAGHARVGGGMLASNEPTPIGVVRTDYSQGEVGPGGVAPASFDPTHGYPGMGAGMGMGMGRGGPSAPMPAAGPGMLPGYGRRPGVLGNLIGYRGPLGRLRAAREDRRASEHAAIPMGMPENRRITELPASMVYGR